MKALILTNEFPPNVYGGAGVHVEYLCGELAKHIQVDVRCFGDQDLTEAHMKVTGHKISKDLIAAAPDKFKSPLHTIMQCVSFNAQPIDADVVHCHTWYAQFGGILAKMLYDIPLVITTHSLEPMRPWKREQLGRGYDFSSWIEKTALEMSDAIIAVSNETRDDVLTHFDVDPDKIVIIPNGIDIDEYQPAKSSDALTKYGIPEDLEYVLFVGRVTRQKGIIHLVRAIKDLDPDIGVVLCAGQPDTEEIGREMREGVEAVQKERDHVYWIPEMVPKRAAIELYSHATVFCCPSVYEPFGIINLEAMACETPVVASAVGGIKEVVVHNETGLLVLFEPDIHSSSGVLNPEQFAQDLALAVNRVFRDKELAQKMAKAGRKRVEEVYSWSTIAERVVYLYQNLIVG
ncbi:MAG: glycogen synthase [SAR324 cluster bacterium]|nr:glycogen synthase [SAR324 cluster bacterium]